MWQNIFGGFNDYITGRDKILFKQKLEIKRYSHQFRLILQRVISLIKSDKIVQFKGFLDIEKEVISLICHLEILKSLRIDKEQVKGE